MHQGVVWRPEDCSSQPSSSAIQVLGLKLSLLGLVASSFTCGAVLLIPDLDSLRAPIPTLQHCSFYLHPAATKTFQKRWTCGLSMLWV